MAEAPARDDILTESDAVNILEELTDAQNHAHLLGLALSINPVDVIAILATYEKPLDRLLHILLKFLSQSEPPPTWRAIVNALRSKAVNLTALAKRVEAAHFPDFTASCDPPTTSGNSSITLQSSDVGLSDSNSGAVTTSNTRYHQEPSSSSEQPDGQIAMQSSISHSLESNQKQQTLASPANAVPDQQPCTSSSVSMKPSTELASSGGTLDMATSSAEVKMIDEATVQDPSQQMKYFEEKDFTVLQNLPGVKVSHKLIIKTTDEPRKRSGVAGLYIDTNFIYYSCTEVPLETETNSQDDTEKKYCVRKCDHKGRLIRSAYFRSFIRGIGMDHQGFLYVVCSAADSQIFKLDKDFNPVRKTANESSRYLGLAYELLVTSDHVLVCSHNKMRICILDLNLNLHFNLNLSFGPIGITNLNGTRYIVTGKGTIGVIDIDFESRKYKIMTLNEMKIDHDTEKFKVSNFRSICTSNEYLLVTEENGQNVRLLCLQLIDNQLRCVTIEKDFSKHCSDTCDKNCSPQVVTHCNDGANYYSQGSFDGNFHIVRVTIMKTEKMFDCN